MPEITRTQDQASIDGASGPSWRYAAAVVWLLFSVALAVWWLVFGLAQIDRISDLAGSAPPELTKEIARRHRMLVSEGATLIVLLLVGGAALLNLVRRETLNARRLREFFASFTHDLKTSLASLRLQAESLEEDLRESTEPSQAKLVRRLVKDTVRLELQLENSLLLASPDDRSRFFLEAIELKTLLNSMTHHWPDLRFEISGQAKIYADHRAVESIVKNLLQNAVVHGRATHVRARIETKSGFAVLRIEDDGSGFKGDLQKLGVMFERHGTSSGSGLGLYLAKSLAERLNGELRFCESDSGFVVEIDLPLADLR